MQAFNKSYGQVSLKGTFIHMIAASSLYLLNSSFINGTALYGGAIYFTGDSNITIEKCGF